MIIAVIVVELEDIGGAVLSVEFVAAYIPFDAAIQSDKASRRGAS